MIIWSSKYQGQWWSIFRTHCPHTEQWWVLSGFTWEHSEQYRTSPWMDRMATGRSLLTANCSNVTLGFTAPSMESISATVSSNLKEKMYMIWFKRFSLNLTLQQSTTIIQLHYLLLRYTSRGCKHGLPVWPNE